MTLSCFLHLLGRHLRQYPARSITALLVLWVAATAVLLLVSGAAALQLRIGGLLETIFPEERIRLEAGRVALGPLMMEPAPITPATVEWAAAQPGVREVLPIEPIGFPVFAEGEMFGMVLGTDVVIHGVPRRLVDDALDEDDPWAAPAEGEPIPVVMSQYFLDLYNLGLARSSGLPLLNPKQVIGRPLTLHLGASVLGLNAGGRASRTVRLELVGLSSQPTMLGLAMPAEVVRALNQEFRQGSDPRYTQLVVDLRPGAGREAFLERAAERNLRPAGGDLMGQRVKTGVRVAGGLLQGLALVVLLLALLIFYLLFTLIFHARRLDLVRLRALGLGTRQVVALALGEVGLITTVAVGAAALTHAVALSLLGAMLAPLLQRVDWLPPDLLNPATPWLAPVAMLLVLLPILPALPMLRYVARVEPGRALRDL